MRFGICNETFGDWPFGQACAYAAECGYEGIEIAPFTLAADAYAITPRQRQEVRSVASNAGLEVIGLHWLLAHTDGYYLTSPDRDVRARTAQYFSELARLCRDLGGRVLVLGSPQQRNLLPGVSHEDAVGYAADVISQFEPVLADQQVVLAIEPLGPQEGDFLNTAQQARELIRQVDSPWCRLHLDVKAMSSETRPIPEIIRENADLLAHFHANDANRRGPGMGQIDFVPILQALQEIGYQQWVSVEVFDYEPGIDALAKGSLDYLQQCLAELT